VRKWACFQGHSLFLCVRIRFMWWRHLIVVRILSFRQHYYLLTEVPFSTFPLLVPVLLLWVSRSLPYSPPLSLPIIIYQSIYLSLISISPVLSTCVAQSYFLPPLLRSLSFHFHFQYRLLLFEPRVFPYPFYSSGPNLHISCVVFFLIPFFLVPSPIFFNLHLAVSPFCFYHQCLTFSINRLQ